MSKNISDAILGKISMETALARETLLYAVQRKIVCPITSHVLDVRTAVYFSVKGKHGTGSEVVDGAAWDGDYGIDMRARCERYGIEITEVIDGRVQE